MHLLRTCNFYYLTDLTLSCKLYISNQRAYKNSFQYSLTAVYVIKNLNALFTAYDPFAMKYASAYVELIIAFQKEEQDYISKDDCLNISALYDTVKVPLIRDLPS